MLNHRIVGALIGASLISACGEGGDATAATPATVVAASFQSLKPGLYHVVQTGDVPGEDEQCIQAADVAAGRFAPGGTIPAGWTIDTNRMSNGTIEVAARHDNGRLNMAGSYEAESFVVDAAIDMTLNGETLSNRSALNGTFVSSECPEMD